MITISIIIVNYNGRRFLERLFATLNDQTFKNFEVIFVDNDSKDDSVDFIRQNYSEAKIVRLKNLGFGTGCNIGAESATGKYLIFLNEDMYLPEDFLEKIIAFRASLDKNNNKKIGGISCNLINFDSDPQEVRENYGASIDLFGFPVKGKNPEDIFAISGSPFFIAKEVFQAAGGFNENIFLYGEDIDLSWRLKIFGFNNFVFQQTQIFHYGGGTTGFFGPEKISENIFSSYIPMITNYKLLTLIFLIPFYFIYLTAVTLVIFIGKQFDGHYVIAILTKLGMILRNMKKILSFRKFVQSKRVKSDIFIFRYISLIPAFLQNKSYKKLLNNYMIKNC